LSNHVSKFTKAAQLEGEEMQNARVNLGKRNDLELGEKEEKGKGGKGG
jgi:hypothetical protein